MFLEGKPSNPFEGKITLMLTISADGTVKDALIISSTTGVKDFDENIINAVCRWTFSKVKSGEIVVTLSRVLDFESSASTNFTTPAGEQHKYSTIFAFFVGIMRKNASFLR